MPVGTGSHPTTPSCTWAPGSRQAGTSLTVGGTKKVRTCPVLGFTLRTSLAPPSATSSPNRDLFMLNGLDTESSYGVPSGLRNGWPSGLCRRSYFRRSAITLTCLPRQLDRITDDGG